MAITGLDLEHWFTYHPPEVEDVPKYNDLRKAAKAFAYEVLKHTPASSDQSAAIRKIREALMTANAAIACKGR